MSGSSNSPLSLPSKVPFVSQQVINGRTGQLAFVNDPAWLKLFQNMVALMGDTASNEDVGTAVAAVVAPAPNWLTCNGAAVSRTTYADLFAVLGTTAGAGDGSTTFNLPNAAIPATGLTWFIKASNS